ncbi:hypothetical protein SAMN05421505_1882, partial [Sinosporangium album]
MGAVIVLAALISNHFDSKFIEYIEERFEPFAVK